MLADLRRILDEMFAVAIMRLDRYDGLLHLHRMHQNTQIVSDLMLNM